MNAGGFPARWDPATRNRRKTVIYSAIGMSGFFATIGALVGGWIGWSIGAQVGLMTGYMLSVVGSAVGVYFGRQAADALLP